MRYEEMTIEGRNAVMEAFRSGKTIDRVYVLKGCQDGPINSILREARKHDTLVNFVAKERLDQMSETGKHQGVIASAAAYAYAEVEDMLKLAEEKGYTVKEDAGRGWRRVVPSPKPVDILEKDTIDSLLGRSIVITCGGGGIPVVKKADGTYEGVAAVIDKDFAAEALAEHVNADVLLILTEVEHVAINFGKPNQENLEKLTAAEARKYMAEGQFAPGSMLPKVEAAVKFVEAKPGKRAIISSLYHAVDAIEGKTGTEIC